MVFLLNDKKYHGFKILFAIFLWGKCLDQLLSAKEGELVLCLGKKYSHGINMFTDN